MKGKTNIKLTEIFMAKCGMGMSGYDRCFHGTIKRDFDNNGNPIVFGKIYVNDGYIVAMASDQWELGEKLDELVIMVLDYGLNDNIGKTSGIANAQFFFN